MNIHADFETIFREKIKPAVEGRKPELVEKTIQLHLQRWSDYFVSLDCPISDQIKCFKAVLDKRSEKGDSSIVAPEKGGQP